jgi:DNA end-binding protein Ku
LIPPVVRRDGIFTNPEALRCEAGPVTARAIWKGFLKVGEVSCSVALYAAASTSERIAFHTINRATGHRVHRQFVDSETGKPVEKDDQVKGYEVGDGRYVMVEPQEIAAAIPEGDKTLDVTAFLACGEIDDTYFDRPYYLAPADKASEEAFAIVREGMRKKGVAAIAQTVLFRRMRTVLIRAHGAGLIATTLNFDYEVRPAKDAFGDISATKIKGEMLDLAEHIIKTKTGKFDPSKFDDRYEAAVAELVKAKLEGKTIEIPKEPERDKVIDLMAALRESAGATGKKTRSKAQSKGGKAGTTKKAAPARKKAAPARRKAS